MTLYVGRSNHNLPRLNEHERRILELETISKPDGPEVRAEIVVARNNGSGFTVPRLAHLPAS